MRTTPHARRPAAAATHASPEQPSARGAARGPWTLSDADSCRACLRCVHACGLTVGLAHLSPIPPRQGVGGEGTSPAAACRPRVGRLSASLGFPAHRRRCRAGRCPLEARTTTSLSCRLLPRGGGGPWWGPAPHRQVGPFHQQQHQQQHAAVAAPAASLVAVPFDTLELDTHGGSSHLELDTHGGSSHREHLFCQTGARALTNGLPLSQARLSSTSVSLPCTVVVKIAVHQPPWVSHQRRPPLPLFSLYLPPPFPPSFPLPHLPMSPREPIN